MRPFLLAAALAAALPGLGADEAEHASRRRALVDQIAGERTVAHGRLDARVLEAMARVPRHRFVPESQQDFAYQDRALPIGEGQTISQPYVVALMTDLLEPRPGHRVLEVGTGSGYQAAVLAHLVERVYTIEIVEPLGLAARERLARLGYRNVEVRVGDGYQGWKENAPFDSIMVTAGADEIPPPLVEQLRPGGRMVIPVGPAHGVQHLTVLEKRSDGSVRSRRVIPVRFVPFTRERPGPGAPRAP